jgi:hypothetical protein
MTHCKLEIGIYFNFKCGQGPLDDVMSGPSAKNCNQLTLYNSEEKGKRERRGSSRGEGYNIGCFIFLFELKSIHLM